MTAWSVPLIYVGAVSGLDNSRSFLSRARRLPTGREPAELRVSHRAGSVHATLTGSSVRMVRRPFDRQGRLVRSRGRGDHPFPIDYVQVFVTLSEYLRPPLELPGVGLPIGDFVRSTRVGPPEAAGQPALLDHFTHHPAKEEASQGEYLKVLEPATRAPQVALGRTRVPAGRRFLSPAGRARCDAGSSAGERRIRA